MTEHVDYKQVNRYVDSTEGYTFKESTKDKQVLIERDIVTGHIVKKELVPIDKRNRNDNRNN